MTNIRTEEIVIERLCSEILRQQKRIANHIETLKGNEAQTRASLIDPMLRTLGWNVENPSQVQLEFKQIDYVLLYDNGVPAAGIEAKPLHSTLFNYYDQMSKYAVQLRREYQTRYFILTNGNIWQLYQDVKTDHDDIYSKRVFEVTVAPTPPVPTGECAFAIAQLWRPDYAVVPPVPARCIRFWPTKSVPVTDSWIRMSGWTARRKPKATLRFPNGNECKIVHWNQLIPYIGDWLYSTGRLADSQIPIRSEDTTRFLLSKAVKHPNGQQFKKPKKLKCGWISDKVSPTPGGHLRDAMYLLRFCRVDPGDVLVLVDPTADK